MVKVAIKTHHGKFLSAQPDGKLEANRDAVGPWEIFDLDVDAKGRVSLRSVHGRYVSAQPDGTVVADRENLDDWERFQADFKGQTFILKSAHGKWITAEKDHKKGHVTNNRPEAKKWETLTLVGTKDGYPFIPGQRYGFRSHHGRYICAEENGTMVANREKLGPWELFKVGNKSDSRIVLETAHGKWVCAEENHSLVGNRNSAGPWEHFHVVPAGHDKVAIRTAHGRLWSAQPDGALVADREHQNEWELFTPEAI